MTNLSLRERRHQQAVKDTARLEAQRDATLDRLNRIVAKLKAARRSVERYERTAPAPMAVTPMVPAKVEPPVPLPAAPAPGSLDGQLEVPGFLRRTPPDAVDAAAAAEIEAANAARRTAKARGRIATMKAKQAGALKRMPLEGKAALAALRG